MTGLGLCMLTGSHAAQYKPLRLASEIRPPYAFEEHGAASGHDIEYVTLLLQRLGYQPVILFCSLTRALRLQQSGNVDGILGISKGEFNERENFLYFTSRPISYNKHVLFYRRDNPFQYEGLPSLRGKNVGVIRGYKYSPAFMYATYFKHDFSKDTEQNINKLLHKRIDLALADEDTGKYLIDKFDAKDKVVFDSTVISGGKLYLALSMQPEFKELMIKLDHAMDLDVEDGELK
jgi:polar amino acid transport system substrate-binding protein